MSCISRGTSRPSFFASVSIDARVTLAQTLMTTLEDREALARIVLDAAAVLRRRK